MALSSGSNQCAFQSCTQVGAITLDDPYRSLAEWVRDSHAFIKCTSDTAGLPQCSGGGSNPPFLEFVWANVLAAALQLPAIYATPVKAQVAPLTATLHKACDVVRRSDYSSLPHWNGGSHGSPVELVHVGPDGCEVDGR